LPDVTFIVEGSEIKAHKLVLGHVRRSSKKGRARGSGARINQREFVSTHLVWLIDCCSFSRRTAGIEQSFGEYYSIGVPCRIYTHASRQMLCSLSTTVALNDTNSYSWFLTLWSQFKKEMCYGPVAEDEPHQKLKLVLLETSSIMLASNFRKWPK
jgi:hypothetical protein